MVKTIPMSLKGRHIAMIPRSLDKNQIYNKWGKVFSIKKIYRVYSPKEKVVLET